MKKWGYFLLVLFVIGLIPTTGQADGKLKGYMFSDYYYVAQHHDSDIEGRHGLWFRRIYFTYDNKLADNLKIRLRLEMASPGDFSSSSTMTPAVKDAYLDYKTGGQSIMFGIIGTPTWGQIEDIWGYRAVEKTPLDLQKLGSSRDFGIALKGHLDNSKTVSYMLMFGNGASNKGEKDNGKKFYGSLGFSPSKGLYLEAYGDYETQKDDKSYYVYQGFASYSGDWGRIGLQYANRHYDHGDTSQDWSIMSAFAVFKAAKNVDLIARFDKMFDANPSGHKISYIPFASNAASNLIIAGISWEGLKNVKLIPNLKYVFYDDPDYGDKPSSNIYANMTVYFKF